MNTAAIKRFLMLLSSAKNLQREQLYQLIQKAESCYCLKDKSQYEFGKALSLFAPPFDLIGDYYQSFYLYRYVDKELAREKLQRVIEQGEQKYKDKALLTLGAIEQSEQNIDEAIKLRLAASKSEFLPVHVEAAIGISSILGAQGEHDKAMAHLERVMPLLSKLGTVPLTFDVYNSYATELAEIGKIELAAEVITPVIVSPYTRYYPNWPETAKEIQEKSTRNSMVTFNRSNVIAFPVREVEAPQEIEEIETQVEEPGFPYQDYLIKKFELEDRVEDWMHGSVEPDDLGTLFIMLGESRDENEREVIIEKAINYTFMHSEESKQAKEQWRDKILSKIKDKD